MTDVFSDDPEPQPDLGPDRDSLIRDIMTPEEIVEAGAALQELGGLKGWSVLLALIDRLDRNIGREVLRERKKKRAYFEGKADCLAELIYSINYMVARATEIKESAEAESKVHYDVRLGRGPATDLMESTSPLTPTAPGLAPDDEPSGGEG